MNSLDEIILLPEKKYFIKCTEHKRHGFNNYNLTVLAFWLCKTTYIIFFRKVQKFIFYDFFINFC